MWPATTREPYIAALCGPPRDAPAAECRAAAKQHEATNQAAYAGHGNAAFEFVPFSVEARGRLGAPALQFVTDLGARAAADSFGAILRQQIVSELWQELSVSLCYWHAKIGRTVTGCLLSPWVGFRAGYRVANGGSWG